jgi:formylglycine-generating enzyme required for sulfatase activity
VTARRPPGLSSIVPQRSESFDLLVQKASGGRGKRYQVKLLRSPAGEPPAGSEHFFTEKDLKAVFGSTEVWRDLRPKGATRTGPEEIGSVLFRALISGEIRSRWDASLPIVRSQGAGLRINLRLDAVPDLEGLPWELLYDRTFLALSTETSVVRYLENPNPVRLERLALPLRVLVVVASPAQCEPLDGEGEWDRLNRALKPLLDGGKVRIARLSPPTLPALEKAMRRPWHIVHFVSHGRFEEGEGSLILEDGDGGQQEVFGKKLKVLLEGQKDLRLVVLNACVGARTSPENLFGGVAQSLAGAGVPAVLAMRTRVSDRAALAFAERFYEAVAGDFPIDGALGEARRTMHAETRDLEWSTPVLYMRAEVEVVPPKHPWRALLAAALSLTALAGGVHWFYTQPDKSSDPACPSPAGLDMSFVDVKPGRFSMGTKGRQVEITKSFCLDKFEVTQGDWKKIMGPPRQQAKEGDKLPVGNVSWNDVQAFLARLAAKDPAAHYRLPTEAQWEFAARAGTSGKYSFGDDRSGLKDNANCSKEGQPKPGGSFQQNPWGLYDMYGNMSELVADWDGPLPADPVRDPTGPATGTEKVRRGGSFTYSLHCDSSYRTGSKPERRRPDTGFRIVRDPQP